jgi:hypothetical protein
MVIDEWQNGIPMAWIMSTWNKNMNLQTWLTTLKDMLKHDLLEWNPNVFIVDDVDVETNTIKWSSWLTSL